MSPSLTQVAAILQGDVCITILLVGVLAAVFMAVQMAAQVRLFAFNLSNNLVHVVVQIYIYSSKPLRERSSPVHNSNRPDWAWDSKTDKYTWLGRPPLTNIARHPVPNLCMRFRSISQSFPHALFPPPVQPFTRAPAARYAPLSLADDCKARARAQSVAAEITLLRQDLAAITATSKENAADNSILRQELDAKRDVATETPAPGQDYIRCVAEAPALRLSTCIHQLVDTHRSPLK